MYIYIILLTKIHGQKIGNPIFKIKEKSECCERISCPGSCRPYELEVKGVEEFEGIIKQFLKVKREFACTFLNCDRPKM